MQSRGERVRLGWLQHPCEFSEIQKKINKKEIEKKVYVSYTVYITITGRNNINPFPIVHLSKNHGSACVPFYGNLPFEESS